MIENEVRGCKGCGNVSKNGEWCLVCGIRKVRSVKWCMWRRKSMRK